MDFEASGDVAGAHALGGEAADRLDLPAYSRRSPLVAAVRLGLGDSFLLAFEHERALELGDRSQDGEDQPAAGGSGVDTERRDAERDLLVLGNRDNLKKVRDRSSQSIEPGDDEGIAFPHEVEASSKLRVIRCNR